MNSFHLDRSQVHFGWSRDRDALTTVASGSSVTVQTQDASGGQVRADSGVDAITSLDFDRVNPVSGPIWVDGAAPGDVLQVDILSVEHSSFGWTAQIPGFGLLSADFPEPWLKVWEIGPETAEFQPGIEIPVRPMCGVLGVAPSAHGNHSVVPPRQVGGNLDIRHLVAGSTLYLPIEVEGALFGVGDTHAAQGDGEVCGTAIESPMEVSLRLTVRKDMQVQMPQYEFTLPERGDATSYYACTGIGPDLLDAAREATRFMVDHIAGQYGVTPQDAYALCSVAVDLSISEVVDAPNWVVSALLPTSIFR